MATRLLDWTESPLVALFFAVRGLSPQTQADRDAAIFTLKPELLNAPIANGSVGAIPLRDHRVELGVHAAFDAMTTPTPTFTAAACTSPQIDLRILVQQGCFSLHTDGATMEDIDGAEVWLTKFVIPQARLNEIAEEFFCLGFGEDTLFPDLEHLSHELNATQFAP